MSHKQLQLEANATPKIDSAHSMGMHLGNQRYSKMCHKTQIFLHSNCFVADKTLFILLLHENFEILYIRTTVHLSSAYKSIEFFDIDLAI